MLMFWVERAKSISPVKASAPPPQETAFPAPSRAIDTPPPTTPPASTPSTMDPPTSQPTAEEVPEFKGFSRSGSKTKATSSATQSPAPSQEASTPSAAPARSASSLARSGTLSWQQRPSSRGAGSRPVSMVSLGSSKAVDSPSSDAEPSRDQIAASLGSRDPSWFRQTADRGVGNAAFRKNKDETPTGDSFASGRRGLPGMSREVSAEPVPATSPPPSESMGSDTMSRYGSTRESTVSSSQFSTNRTSTSSKPDLKALIAEDAEQEKASPMSDQTSTTDGEQSTLGRTPTMSSSQARLAGATERPSSPTKGMGGFVQSAMMKRSESVNKRWSAQPGSSLSRNNSTASAQSGYGGLTGSHSMPKLEPTPSSRESSKEPNSRPTSSSSNLTQMTATQDRTDKDGFVKPGLPHSRSKSIITSNEDGQTSEPSSPSKRWSPNKSTWLESAITKPESPKPMPAARNSQPSWMADIAKAKAQRASGDSTPKPAQEESSRPGSPTKAPFGQGMLKRSESRDLDISRTSTPKLSETPGSRSASPTKTSFGRASREIGTSEAESAQLPNLAKTPSSNTIGSKPTTSEKTETKVDEPQAVTEKAAAPSVADTKLEKQSEPAAVQPKESPRPSVAKPKPEAPPKPQTDFRSNLRSRGTSEAKQQETPEFLSKFGSLKKTTTQNYVAPDVLKDNILRGKADLAKTGGPVKTQRRDELKESLLAKKEQWKKEKEDGIVHERKVSNPPQTPQKPEALAKRDLLGRSESIKAAASPEKPRDATPEALARHKSLKEKPKPEAALPALEKQKSEPLEAMAPSSSTQAKKATETSKMAARFNPGLAGILARGPPGRQSGTTTPGESDSVANPNTSRATQRELPSEPPAEGAQLQDMRKDRAKGPKRRKAGARDVETETSAPVAPGEPQPALTPSATEDLVESSRTEELVYTTPKPKPRAPPGSAASIMMASLKKAPSNESKPSIPAKNPSIASPKLPAEPATSSTPVKAVESPAPKADVPDFKGFSSAKKPGPAFREFDNNKENGGGSSPSVKSAASKWGQPSMTKRTEPPAQIQLPSKKDEEAAMRSAGLLASSPTRPGSSNGLAIKSNAANGGSSSPSTPSTAPARPSKPSRAVSGQLQEASPNKGA